MYLIRRNKEITMHECGLPCTQKYLGRGVVGRERMGTYVSAWFAALRDLCPALSIFYAVGDRTLARYSNGLGSQHALWSWVRQVHPVKVAISSQPLRDEPFPVVLSDSQLASMWAHCPAVAPHSDGCELL